MDLAARFWTLERQKHVKNQYGFQMPQRQRPRLNSLRGSVFRSQTIPEFREKFDQWPREVVQLKREKIGMKRLLLLGTIAAMALTTTGQAQSQEQRSTGSGRVVTRHPTTERTTVSRPTNRTVVRNYNRGGRYYYGGNRYFRGYYNRPSVSIGFGGYYGPGYYGYGYPYAYDYAYGYPYNYGYGYNYPSDYYAGYPNGYATTTYTTSRYGDLAYDDNVVVAVQDRLKRAGYYLGAIDGVAGPETRSAIARWEGNHGMTADGRIDGSTLRSLGISA